jgi:hypothetical protein
MEANSSLEEGKVYGRDFMVTTPPPIAEPAEPKR